VSEEPKKQLEPAPLPEHLREFRGQLVALEQQSQTAFDKTLLSLGGGALAVSFAFLKDFLRTQGAAQPKLIFAAWLCWTASIAVVLVSHLSSVFATRRAINDLKTADPYGHTRGGWLGLLTDGLNILGGAAFVVGLVLAGMFVLANLTQVGAPHAGP
jgi:hypothetical protein